MLGMVMEVWRMAVVTWVRMLWTGGLKINVDVFSYATFGFMAEASALSIGWGSRMQKHSVGI